MIPNQVVVLGEAPESDEERNVSSYKNSRNSIYHLKGDEFHAPKYSRFPKPIVHNDTLKSAKEIASWLAAPSEQMRQKLPNSRLLEADDGSLLEKILCNSNEKFWEDLNIHLFSTILIPSNDLINTDKQLLKSQITLQGISYKFAAADKTMKRLIRNSIELTSAKFLPQIKIPQ